MLGALLILFLARTLAYPVDAPPDNPLPPTSSSPILNAVVDAAGCIRDPKRVRSLWELLYSCLGTIAICTYIAIHPNMPDLRDSWSTRMLQKLKTTFYALLAPEAVIVWAMSQNLIASRVAEQYKAYGWTKTHGFFVQMGGLIYDDGKSYRVITVDGDGTGDVWIGGEKEEWMKNLRMPIVAEEEILDKAKGDLLSKMIAVLQTSWFVLQCITRHAQGLNITELELVTLAFATLNIITYFLWWKKPLNASYPIYFKPDGQRSNGPLRVPEVDNWRSESYRGWWIGSVWDCIWPDSEKSLWQRMKEDIGKRSLLTTFWKRLIKNPFAALFGPLLDMISTGPGISKQMSVTPYSSGYVREKDHALILYGSVVIGVFFGAVHLIGWNFKFPTEEEKKLWRTSSLVVTLFPTLIALKQALENMEDSSLRNDLDKIASFLFLLIAPVIYVLARLVLLVLPLFALRDLPPSAYQNVVWSQYIPHI
ncbi:hypothetical protein AX16_006329 [Volvariella volvacea WC 439]|nr:hypothetical protein AX16_006329 [Volvariella volvacea WC 439]